MSKKGAQKIHDREKNFYPDYLIEIIFVFFIIIETVFILALLSPPVIGRPIDLSAGFQPKPEWYFLWLYQLVRYFPGKTAFIGTVVLPFLFFILLLFIPYIDRGRYGYLISAIVGLFLLLSFLILTIIPTLN